MVRSRGRMLDWSLHQWAQRPIGSLTRVRIGDAQPIRRLLAPVAQHYKREWGPRAQTTRFAAATINPLTPNPSRPRGCAEESGSTTALPQDLAAAVRVCTARRCLVQNITDRTRGVYRISRYVIHRIIPLDLLLVDPANLSWTWSNASLGPQTLWSRPRHSPYSHCCNSYSFV
jgi:hypothetical protein